MQNKAVGRIIAQAEAIKPMTLASAQGYRLLWRRACLEKKIISPRGGSNSVHLPRFTFANLLKPYAFYQSYICCMCIVCATLLLIIFRNSSQYIWFSSSILHVETLHIGSDSSVLHCVLIQFAESSWLSAGSSPLLSHSTLKCCLISICVRGTSMQTSLLTLVG